MQRRRVLATAAVVYWDENRHSFGFTVIVIFTFQLLDRAVVTGVFPSLPPVLAFIVTAHRVQHSHNSLIFILSHRGRKKERIRSASVIFWLEHQAF